YYRLSAFERDGTLSGQREIAGVDWYSKGAQLLLARQKPEGNFPGTNGEEIETSFAVLFLVRSTYISRHIHVKRLGRGTLVSGRGIPANLAELEQVGGQFKAKAIRGKTGDLLQLIETGKPDQAEGAAEGLLKGMYTKKWTAGGQDGDRLRRALEKGFETKNSAVIKAALKGLALTGDFRVVPLLIDGMYYEEDEEVMLAARDSLCLISRK